MSSNKARKGSRRVTYKDWLSPEALIKLEGWAKSGLTDEQIAKNIGISRPTIYDWKNKYPDIANALKKGKEIVDFEVENALLKRALGYTYEEIHQTVEKDDRGREKKRVEKITRTVVPDVTAQIFWLKNRKPNDWRNNPTDLDRKEQESRIERNKAGTDKLRGDGAEVEDLSEIYGEIYGE